MMEKRRCWLTTELPPVDERLPVDPMAQLDLPWSDVGHYGGTAAEAEATTDVCAAHVRSLHIGSSFQSEDDYSIGKVLVDGAPFTVNDSSGGRT